MDELTLSEIWIYPIKSLGGFQTESSLVLEKGLQYDRRWMLVDDQGVFLTQRTHPQLAIFKTSIAEEHIEVRYQLEIIKIDINLPAQSPNQKVKIWDDEVYAYEVNRTVSEWFSTHLGFTCKLVFFPESHSRLVDHNYQINNENVSLADAYPFLIIGQKSLDDLNSRLNDAVPMNLFRPNFVFTGGKAAFYEDSWANFKIGNHEFVAVKPCSRCILITTDQETAKRSAEPLKTLSRYRSKNNKVYFGQNLISLTTGEVNVGDAITVLTYQ